jgi:hypothetical protein
MFVEPREHPWSCLFPRQTVCGSGGGGGGVSVPGCSFGAGFNVSFSATLSAGGQPSTCVSDAQDDATAVAVTTCNARCGFATDYNGCFCPCFQSAITDAGLVWGARYGVRTLRVCV